jgi:hypothetical protein
VSPAILEASAAVSGTIGVAHHNLYAFTEKLASLRYLIILTARWETSDSVTLDRRKVMSRDLARLRREYSVLIDDIAMNFSVQAAMDAKEEIERKVMVPKSIKPSASHFLEDRYSI